LRPFALTEATVDELPIGTISNVVAPSMTTGKLEPMLVPVVETLHWGFSIQYST